MNLKSELQKMNTSDLKGICRELGIKCPTSKSDIIKRLLNPLKQTYNWNLFGKKHQERRKARLMLQKERRNARLMLQKERRKARLTLHKHARGYLARKKYKPILKYKRIEKSRCEKKCKDRNYKYAYMEPYDCQQKCRKLHSST